MKEILELAADAIRIDQSAVVRRLGSPEGTETGNQLREALTLAEESLIATATPRCVVEAVNRETFAVIFDGAGNNDPGTPLQEILERDVTLALFAVTLGQAVTDRIKALFAEHDFLTATLLDAMASAVAEDLVESLETRFGGQGSSRDGCMESTTALAYSPGYCGWHVSGQQSLFAALQPQSIGISLAESFMMQPLKSVSGVLVAGRPDVHTFDMAYSCCTRCVTLECRTRIARVQCPDHCKKEVAWTCSSE